MVQRRGSIYLMALGVSMIVAIVGLAALMAIRLQGRTVNTNGDFIAARLYARSAIDLGMYCIQSDTNWRTHRGNGAWFTDQPIGDGTFSLTAHDPIDNDVSTGENHPVILTATASKGAAVYKTQVRLEVSPKSNSPLAVSLQSGSDLVIEACQVTGNQTIASNATISATDNSVINANVEYYDNLEGEGFAQSTRQLPQQRPMPNIDEVMSGYTANGTPIDYTSLAQSNQDELFTNPNFDSTTNSWYVYANTSGQSRLCLDDLNSKNSQFSLLITNRQSSNNTIAQDLTIDEISSGNTYFINMPTYVRSPASAQATLLLTTSTGSTLTFSTQPVTLNAGTWTDVRGTVTPQWTGTLSRATVMLSMNNTLDYNVDAVTMFDATQTGNTYAIHNTLLSPSCNPFGSKTNPQGIYVINCGGQNISISDCRIVGTLVLRNTGSDSTISGSVMWEPAVSNYPAIISDGNLTIATQSTALAEYTIGANLNPFGTPYPYDGGSANSTFLDSYSSKITGIVYAANDLLFQNTTTNANPTIAGVVLANGTIDIRCETLTLNYLNTFYADPPPKFDLGTLRMYPVAGSWQRTTD